MSIAEFDRRASWSHLNAGKTVENKTFLWVGMVEGMAETPPPLPTGIMNSPQFCSHQEAKMAAHQTQ